MSKCSFFFCKSSCIGNEAGKKKKKASCRQKLFRRYLMCAPLSWDSDALRLCIHLKRVASCAPFLESALTGSPRNSAYLASFFFFINLHGLCVFPSFFFCGFFGHVCIFSFFSLDVNLAPAWLRSKAALTELPLLFSSDGAKRTHIDIKAGSNTSLTHKKKKRGVKPNSCASA